VIGAVSERTEGEIRLCANRRSLLRAAVRGDGKPRSRDRAFLPDS
jgi:hypothetical protein